METRETNIKNSRPHLLNVKSVEGTSSEELFQNNTLRPVIKYQQDLLLEVFKNYINKHKNGFYELNVEEKLLFIENAIQKDIKFRNVLKGIVLGQFTVKEYSVYINNSSALNKRMMWLIKDRLQDNIQILALPNAI